MRIVFIGTGEIGVPTLRAVHESGHEIVGVVTQPDKPVGRDQRIEAPPIKKAALEMKMSILQPARMKDRQSIEDIRALQPDAIVVVAYGQILPRDVLEIPSVACLNVHASLLPRWRGAAPIQYAIAAGDRETGITIMYMDEGLDTGDALLQRKIDILPNETGGSLHDRLAQIAPDALLDALKSFPNAPRIPQDNSQATVAPKLKRENGAIDWNELAEVIERKIRAFNPWPGAFTKIDNRNLKIFSATIVDLSGKPGHVWHRDDEVIIAAKDRALSLREVQLEGKRRMSATEFLRGHANLLSKA
jgi:methionyl-tRNA formyltransferase